MKSTSVLSSSPMYCTIFLFTHGLILPVISESSTTPQASGYANSLALSDGMLSISSLCFFFLSSIFVLVCSFSFLLSFEPNGMNLRFFGCSSSSSSSLNISDTCSLGRFVITIGSFLPLFCTSWLAPGTGVDLFESVFSEMGLKVATWTCCWSLSGSGVASLETCRCVVTWWWGSVLTCGLSNSELLMTTVDVSVVMMFSLLAASTSSSSTSTETCISSSLSTEDASSDSLEDEVSSTEVDLFLFDFFDFSSLLLFFLVEELWEA